MGNTAAPRQYRRSGVGSFSDWIGERELEQRTVARVLAQEAIASQIAKASVAPAPTPPPLREHRRNHKSRERPMHAQGSHAKRATASGFADAPPAIQHRLARLRPLATGEELKSLRRSARAHRLSVLSAIAMVAVAALISVVARAEIAKMQLKADAIAPTLATLVTQNQQLSVSAQQLSAPARIAAVAQNQLHMVFPSGSGVAAVASSLATASAASQPYSLYYTAAGSDPTTTVAPVPTTPVKAAPSSSTPAASATASPATTLPAVSVAAASVAPPSTAPVTTPTTAPSKLTLVTPSGAPSTSNGG